MTRLSRRDVYIMIPATIIFIAIVIFWVDFRRRHDGDGYQPNSVARMFGSFTRNVARDLEQGKERAGALGIEEVVNQLIASSTSPTATSTASSTPNFMIASSTATQE